MKENTVKIASTNFTPSIIIDYNKNYVKMEGRSIPEDAYDFYFIITQKLKSISDLTLEVDFEYMNSGSLRFLTIAIVSELNIKKVIWHHVKDDEDIEEKGKLIKEIMNKEQPKVEFILIEKS